MGNVSGKGFVYSSNDYQLAIEASKELEHLLEHEFNAHGQGLHEMVSSVERLLPVPTGRSIRYVATLRNRLIHDRQMRALPDRPLFISKFDNAMTELNILIDQKRRGSYAPAAAAGAAGCVIS